MKRNNILWLLRIKNDYAVIINDNYKELNIIEDEIVALAKTYSDILKSMHIKDDTKLVETLVILSVEKMIGKISQSSMIRQVKDIIDKSGKMVA